MDKGQRSSADASSVTRRDFLKTSTAAAVAGAAATQLLPRAFAQGGDALKAGLIGCGGRGTGAAMNTLAADPTVQLVAMADAFQDRLEGSLNGLKGQEAIADRVLVEPNRQYVGLDAFQQLIDSDVDVVLDCSVPHFRPRHLEAAIAADKHVFAEKPVATDPVGVHKILELTEQAKEKGLSLVSGLCWRYETGMQETIERIQEGQIGDIVAIQSTRFSGVVGAPREREAGWGDFEYQLRNWHFYEWLCGDFIVEQFVHELDKIAWLMGEYPTSCVSSGGRAARIDEPGNIFDHFSAIFEFANGVRYFAAHRHINGCANPFIDYVMGTEGTATLGSFTITGENPWKGEGNLGAAYVREHAAMYEGIRNGEPVNNGEYMAKSTLMGIMGRMAAYTGQSLSWDQMMESEYDLTPPEYDMKAELPEPAVAIPGVTPFV